MVFIPLLYHIPIHPYISPPLPHPIPHTTQAERNERAEQLLQDKSRRVAGKMKLWGLLADSEVAAAARPSLDKLGDEPDEKPELECWWEG